ncbi:hypothetical protein AABM36_10695 [Kocuria sp. KSNUG]|uniref:hypothetical protein n=1 Tax=Kocuria sp. KSNUG TaxID=3136676 RepID=UPI003C2FB16E
MTDQLDRRPPGARSLAQNGAASIISLLISDLAHEELAASGILRTLVTASRRATTPIGRLSAVRPARCVPPPALTGRSTSRARRF